MSLIDQVVVFLLGASAAFLSRRWAERIGLPLSSWKRDLVGVPLAVFLVVFGWWLGLKSMVLLIVGCAVGLYGREVRAFLEGKKNDE